jgi:quercetin 2,3-dioxygenase
MFRVRRAEERGHADHGWLDSRHTFSFADYDDPDHRGFRVLRVINEDRVRPGAGFGAHGHRDMEILSYVLAGALEHKDSLGNGSVLRPGEFQCMTAGSGVRHSEFNPSPEDPVHFYQVWILPERAGLPPSYEQRAFAPEDRAGRWQLVAAPPGATGALVIHQDARVYLASLATGRALSADFAAGRHGWLQVLAGECQSGDLALSAGDGLAISDESRLELTAVATAELMLFDLP